MTVSEDFKGANYERLSVDTVRQLHQKFLDRIDATARKALINKENSTTPPPLPEIEDKIGALKAYLYAASRKNVGWTSDGLARLAASDVDDIRRKTEGVSLKHDFKANDQALIDAAAAQRQEPPIVRDVFGDQDRIYLKLTAAPDVESDTQGQIIVALSTIGYTVTDYNKGYATDAKGKQTFKIGKLLKDNGYSSLYNLFVEDCARTGGQMLAVISRNLDDITHMSTNRGWKSCMSSNGIFFTDYVPQDVKQGTLIAYLVSAKDPDITKPLARILLRPYNRTNSAMEKYMEYSSDSYRQSHPVESVIRRSALRLKWLFNKPDLEPGQIYVPERRQYGLKSKAFAAAVTEFTNRHFNKSPDGNYVLATGLYEDYTSNKIKKRDNALKEVQRF